MPKKTRPESHAESRLFGTDGVRGVANQDPMTPEIALRIGQAAVAVASVGIKHRPRILIGKDTRLSGYMLENAMVGIVISASHNPFQDNGIKIFGRDGFKLADDLEARIEGLVRGSIPPAARKTGPGIGHAFKVDDARGR